MLEHEVAAAAAIRAAFERPVTYNGAGLADVSVMAVRSDMPAPGFQGPGETVRQLSYEIAQAALPQKPRKGNTITDPTGTWKVMDVTKRDDVGAWELVVEEP